MIIFESIKILFIKIACFLFLLSVCFLFFSNGSLAQTTIWSEDFSYDNGTITGNGSPEIATWESDGVVDMANNQWYNDYYGIGVCEGMIQACYSTYFYPARDTWQIIDSDPIEISGYSNISISIDISAEYFWPNNTILVEYKLDGGNWTTFETNGSPIGDWFTDNISLQAAQTNLNGNELYIRVTLNNDYSWKYFYIDNVIVEGTPTSVPDCAMPYFPEDNAVFVGVDASLSWNAVSGANGYKLYLGTSPSTFSIENGTDLGNVTSYTPTNGFAASTNYYWKIIPYNNLGDATGCLTNNFETDVYCSTVGQYEDRLYISNVHLNTIDNSTDYDEGYGDYTGISTTLFTEESYELTVAVDYYWWAPRMYIYTWIDWNQDGDFDDSNESYYLGRTDNSVSTTITVPATAVEGTTKMRIIASYSTVGSSCPTSSYNGEAEDYSIIIKEQLSFSNAGTYTVDLPEKICKLTIECWGGGGGGAYSASRYNKVGGGGGGGYAKSTLTVPVAGNYTVTVGGGGNYNSDGSESTVSHSGEIIIKGDYGRRGTSTGPYGVGGSGVGGSSNIGDFTSVGGAGGAVYNQYSNQGCGGGGGGSAGPDGDGNNGNMANRTSGATGGQGDAGNGGAGGAGGNRNNSGTAGSGEDSPLLGGGGGGGSDWGATAGNGGFPGGGGGGTKTTNGGVGANGRVILSWVIDTIAPTVICNSGVEVYADENGDATIDVSMINNGSYDDCCGIDTMWLVPNELECSASGDSIDVTLYVQDSTGNIGSSNTIVIMQDTIPPIFTCPSDTTISEGIILDTLKNITDFNATDNCSGVSHVSLYSETLQGDSVIIRTYRIYDNEGNYASCSQTISINGIGAAITAISSDACPQLETLQNFNPDNDNYNEGYSVISFEVARISSAVTWEFDFEIDEDNNLSNFEIINIETSDATINYSGSTGGTYSGSCTSIAESTEKITLNISVKNQPGKEQAIVCKVTSITDTHNNATSNYSDNSSDITIYAMPIVGVFN